MPKRPLSLSAPAPILCLALLLSACAEPRPVFYPNSHYRHVGQATADYDTEVCQEMADAAGADRGDDRARDAATQAAVGGAIGGATGAAVGAVVGNPGQSAAAGAAGAATAGFMRAILKPPQSSPAYRQFVTRCLSERGYAVVGWD